MGVVKLRVTTVIKEIEFTIPSKKTARELFLEICKNIGIKETWYFGLSFVNPAKETIWIDASKKKMAMYKDYGLHLRLCVKYFPEDVEDIIENVAKKHFYLQLKSEILSDKLFCPSDTCVLLASYYAQIKYGDYDDDYEFEKDTFLPDRVYEQHKLDRREFLKSIIELWKKHKGMDCDDAMLEYLKITQNLEMFGVHYFTITNSKGSKVVLGIFPLGLNVYRAEDKLNPIIMFPWSEILHLNFRGKKFIIKTVDKTQDFSFLVEDPKVNKRILNLGIGYHQMYVNRRSPDTLEVMQMKEHAIQQKKIVQAQREKLLAELNMRQKIEIRYQEEIKILREEMNKMQKSLADSQATIEKLNKQLEDVQKAKQELEAKQLELEEMMLRLQESKDMEASEKQKLEEEIMAKQNELRSFEEEVALKDAETKRLQEEIELAKIHQEQLMQQQREETLRRQEEQSKLENLVADAHTEIPELNKINDALQQELKDVQTKLMESRDVSNETTEDKIHWENVCRGRDKYKTLQQVRKGNTKRRVDLFENL